MTKSTTTITPITITQTTTSVYTATFKSMPSNASYAITPAPTTQTGITILSVLDVCIFLSAQLLSLEFSQALNIVR